MKSLKLFFLMVVLVTMYGITTIKFGPIGLLAIHLIFGFASIVTFMYLGWKQSNYKGNFLWGAITQIRKWNTAVTCTSTVCLILGGLAILALYHVRGTK